MNTAIFSILVTASLVVAVLLGQRIRRIIPEHHLNADTRDTVKLAMGLVATMSALLLGLLVSSAKGSYDTTRSEVIQMAAKITFLDRVLIIYGPEAAQVRGKFREVAGGVVQRMWPEDHNLPARLAPDTQAGDALYFALEGLTPQNDTQRAAKAQAASLATELAQLRTLLMAQSAPSISKALLIVVVCWLLVIFFSFSLLAPPNPTASLALLVSAVSVAGAIFLILELDQPFGGLIRISSEPMLNALNHLAK